MPFNDKVVIVTGASRGIGRATAVAFGAQGATVVVNYLRRSTAAEETADMVRAQGGGARVIQADVAQSADVRRLVEQTQRELGPIDVLVNNAGVVVRKDFLTISEADWDWQFDVNVKGVFLVSQYVARQMADRGKGSIVNVSSIDGSIAEENRAAYVASKGAVTMLTQAMALDLVRYGVRVNAVAPGIIATEDVTGGVSYSYSAADWVPTGALGRPDECAAAILFLASEAASHVIGQVLFVDGGLSCRQPLPLPR
jgi:3-oxoacyl-[acyl-carrier protein] reductase